MPLTIDVQLEADQAPQYLNVSAMKRLMDRGEYGVCAGMKHGIRVQLAQPIGPEGACRPGPVYRWVTGMNGWVFERHQFCQEAET